MGITVPEMIALVIKGAEIIFRILFRPMWLEFSQRLTPLGFFLTHSLNHYRYHSVRTVLKSVNHIYGFIPIDPENKQSKLLFKTAGKGGLHIDRKTCFTCEVPSSSK